jgi:hypothetical protein
MGGLLKVTVGRYFLFIKMSFSIKTRILWHKNSLPTVTDSRLCRWRWEGENTFLHTSKSSSRKATVLDTTKVNQQSLTYCSLTTGRRAKHSDNYGRTVPQPLMSVHILYKDLS